MLTTAASASSGKTRKAGTATVPTSHNFHHSNVAIDTTEALQLQRLAEFGLAISVASAVAPHVFGGRYG